MVGGLRRSWSRRAQIFGNLNKDFGEGTQIAKQQQHFIEGESRKYTS
jgi:hypothetical protein